MFIARCFFALYVLLFCGFAQANSNDANTWAERLFVQLSQAESMRALYRFTETKIDEDEQTVAIYDPRLSPSWTLISLNGATPTEKEQKKFLKHRMEEDDDDRSMTNMVDESSLKITKQDEDTVTLAFRPLIEQFPESQRDAIQGEAVFDSVSGHLLKLEMRAVKPFSPIFAAKIETMNMVFGFQQQDGMTLMQDSSYSIKGVFAAVREFDTNGTVVLSDIERVIDVQEVN